MTPEPFTIVYDLRDPDAWNQARRHRAFWGRLYTDIAPLDNDHVVLTFRPAPDVRWRPWERVRKEWIMREVRCDASTDNPQKPNLRLLPRGGQ